MKPVQTCRVTVPTSDHTPTPAYEIQLDNDERLKAIIRKNRMEQERLYKQKLKNKGK